MARPLAAQPITLNLMKLEKVGHMAIRDWSKSARLAFGYALVVLTLSIAFGPPSLLLANGELLRSLRSSAQIFGAYAAIITIVTTTVTAAFLSWRIKRHFRHNFAAYTLLGGVVGLIVGLLMIPITVGVSLVVAPAAGVITSVIVVIIRERLRGKKSDAKPS